jgi:PAS domain S-box-containing protein
MTDSRPPDSPADRTEIVALRQRIVDLELRLMQQSATAEAARLETDRLKHIFDTVADAIFINDDRDEILDVNSAACDLLGYSREELMAMRVTDLIAPEHRQAEGEQVRHEVLLRTAFESVNVRKDGHHIPVEVRTTPLYVDEDGHMVTVSVVRDIRERRQAEQALRQSEERFRTVADFTYDWEYWHSPTGEMNYASPSCERITGYAPGDFETNPMLLAHIVHPEDRPHFEDHLQAEANSLDHAELEFRILTKGGEERWIGHVCRPVYDSDGRYLGRRASNRDITRLKAAEQESARAQNELEHLVEARTAELRQAKEQLQAQFKAAPVPTYIWQQEDEDLVLRDYNDAALAITRGKIAEYEGISAAKLYAGQPEIREAIERTLVEQRGSKHEMDYVHQSTGETRHMAVSYAFVPPDQVLVHTDDISEERRAMEKLRASEAKYRSLFENAQVGAFRANRDGSALLEVNQRFADMLGHTADEMVGLPVARFLGESQRYAQMMQQLHQENSVTSQEIAVRVGDETPKTFLASLALDAETDSLQGTLLDITARKEAEQELDRWAQVLAEANAELQRFNQLAVGRELRMIELKQEVNALALQLGQSAPYDLSFVEDPQTEGERRRFP